MEPLLACHVPKVHKDSLAIYCGCVLVERQCVCGQLLELKSIHEKSLHEFGLAHSAGIQADDFHIVISIVFLLVQLTGFGFVPSHWLLAIETASAQGRGDLVTAKIKKRLLVKR